MRLQGQMACGFSMTKQVAQLSKKRGGCGEGPREVLCGGG